MLLKKTELKTKLISANNKIIDVKISSRPYNYRSKKVRVVVIQDITKINEYIRSIMAAQKELRILNSTKDKLLAIIGHDLKNPFNAITGFSDLMKDSWRSMEPKEVDEMLHMINQSSLAAHSLLENLLNWARIQTEQLKLNQTSFYLLSSIKEAFSVLRSSTKIKQIDIKIDCNENILMYADYSMVTTIIRNLLSNAIKFSHREGLINVSATENSDFITISVKDNGVGMSEEEVESIFRIENISSKNGTDNEKGTGLGLTLCKEIIQAHKGNISIESELGKGSKFTVMFPKKNTNY